MTTKPKATSAAEQIAALSPILIFHGCRATDPAVGHFPHTEFFTELDQTTQSKVMAARLDAEAEVLKALADGHSKMAGVLKSGG